MSIPAPWLPCRVTGITWIDSMQNMNEARRLSHPSSMPFTSNGRSVDIAVSGLLCLAEPFTPSEACKLVCSPSSIYQVDGSFQDICVEHAWLSDRRSFLHIIVFVCEGEMPHLLPNLKRLH